MACCPRPQPPTRCAEHALFPPIAAGASLPSIPCGLTSARSAVLEQGIEADFVHQIAEPLPPDRTMGSSHHVNPWGNILSYPQYPQQQTQQTQPQTRPQDWQGGEPPLWAPYYGAPFPAAVKRFFAKYATFSGRASRSEYWWWVPVSYTHLTLPTTPYV